MCPVTKGTKTYGGKRRTYSALGTYLVGYCSMTYSMTSQADSLVKSIRGVAFLMN